MSLVVVTDTIIKFRYMRQRSVELVVAAYVPSLGAIGAIFILYSPFLDVWKIQQPMRRRGRKGDTAAEDDAVRGEHDHNM